MSTLLDVVNTQDTITNETVIIVGISRRWPSKSIKKGVHKAAWRTVHSAES